MSEQPNKVPTIEQLQAQHSFLAQESDTLVKQLNAVNIQIAKTEGAIELLQQIAEATKGPIGTSDTSQKL